jgi:Homing endonuclease associated repeat/HNH endonuclease
LNSEPKSKESQSFSIKLRVRNIPDEDLLSDLLSCAQRLSKDTLTKTDYDEHGRFGATTILRRFKQWNLAIAAAGLVAPNRQNIPDEELLENIAAVWTELGRQPVGKEMDKTLGLSKFSLGTYEKRFGSWNKSLLAFSQHLVGDWTDRETTLGTSKVQTAKQRETSRKINWRLRAQVLIRDGCVCRMCGTSPLKDATVVLHADHILPWSKGGETTLENLQTLCHVCNIGKSDMTL